MPRRSVLLAPALLLAACAWLLATAVGAAAAPRSRSTARDTTGTIGVTTVGGAVDPGGANYLDSSGPYTLPSSATLTKLTGYVEGGASPFPVRAVVYADDAGRPGALVAVTPEVTIAASQAPGWVDFAFASPVSVPAGGYWLGYWYGSSDAGFFSAVAAGSERYVPAAYSSTGDPPSTYGAASTASSSYSLYATYTVAAGGGSPPASTSPPVVSGSPVAGQTLSVSPGSWSNAPTAYGYRWQDCDSSGSGCAAISGATSASYVLQAADVGHTVRVEVTASNASGSATAVSAATAVVTASGGGGGGGGSGSGTFGQSSVGTLVDTGAAGYLDVSGPYAVGSTVSITKLTAYVAGGGAASTIRGVVYADAGGRPDAFVAVTPVLTVAAGSAPGWVDLVLPSPVSVPAGSYWLGYWYGDGNSSHYETQVTGSERYAPAPYSSTAPPPSSFPAASTSDSSYAVYATYTTQSGGASPPASTAPPAISGTPEQGQTLTASTGTWTNSPTSYAYRWQDCDSGGGTCTAIAGATGQSYLLAASDVAHTIRVQVTATNAAGSAAASSAPTGVVASGAGSGIPSSLAALGDSLTRAYGAGGLGEDYPADSWSAGSATAVDSIYERLVALNPALSGNEFNDAVSGSQVAATLGQASTAVSQGAAFVTLWTGTNDVCTVSSGAMTSVASFTSSLQATLSELTSGLPGVRVVVLSIPDWYGFWQAYQSDASAESAWDANANRCPDLLLSSATAADRAAVQQRISDLNAAIASVCAEYSGCSTDGGAVFSLWPTLPASDLAFDYFHLSPAGQAAVAAAVWATLPWSAGGGGAPPAAIAPPSIAGTAQQGQTLTASTGTWSNAPTGFAYEWEDCDSAGAGCAAIAGAAGSSYVLQAADVGHTVRVAVTASNAAGSSPPSTSDTTAVVAASGSGGGGTFGQTAAGTLIDRGGAGYLDVSGPYAVGSAATLTKLTAYVGGGSSASSIRGVVYADAGGQPGALVAATPQVAIAAGSAAGWVDLAFSSPVPLAAGSYWLGYWYADSNSDHYDLLVTGSERYAPAAYSATAAPPATFPSPASADSSYSLYGSYTTP